MGTINENLCSNDISFQNITKMFNYILSQEKTKAQNMNVLKEIGIIKEYSYLIYEKNSKDIKYVSKNHKTLKNYIKQKKAKSYFIKWICLIFDIQEQYYNLSLLHQVRQHHTRRRIKLETHYGPGGCCQHHCPRQKHLLQLREEIRLST